MKRVIIESPYAGKTNEETERNIRYVRACMRDSLMRGEAPLASHLLYTQEGILDDKITEERSQGINAGLIWGNFAELICVYTDLSITEGMIYAIDYYRDIEIPIEYRELEGWNE